MNDIIHELIIIFKKVILEKAMDRFLKKNLEANSESSPSNIDADQIPGTSGRKNAKSVISRKYCTNYISFGFTFAGNVTDPVPLCMLLADSYPIVLWSQANLNAIWNQNTNLSKTSK